jgi:hypothetical protein
VILSTGSHPRVLSLHEKYNPNLQVLDLDTVLRKSLLPDLFHLDESSSGSSPHRTIGIVGNSHSGILALRNLYEVLPSASTSLVLFERHPIVYAEFLDEGIVHDNTGLKGTTAEWSKQFVDCDSPGEGRIHRVQLGSTPEQEDKAYREWMARCTHLVYAVGYQRSRLPLITAFGKRVDEEMVFDMHTSGFHVGAKNEDTMVPRLYGCGIAFPEEVMDPRGNVEAAVGVGKFFKFVERVAETWVHGLPNSAPTAKGSQRPDDRRSACRIS